MFELHYRSRSLFGLFISSSHSVLSHRSSSYLVRVTVSKVWVNCPRYIHRYQKLGQSKYVPQAACETPLASCRRLDMVQNVLPADEQKRARQVPGYSRWRTEAKVASGDG